MTTKWISLEDREPKHNIVVLAWYPHWNRAVEAIFVDMVGNLEPRWEHTCRGLGWLHGVTHWQLLPGGPEVKP